MTPSSNSIAVEQERVETGPVLRAPFRDYLPLRAQVVPLQTVYIAAVTGGQVAELAATDGQAVVKGTPLVRLSNPGLGLEVASRSAEIIGQLSNISGQRASIERNQLDLDSEIARARNDLMQAEHALRVQQTLFEKNIVEKSAVEPRAAQVAYQRGRVASLEAGRRAERKSVLDQRAKIGQTARQLGMSLGLVQDSLQALVIRAPVAGRLTAFTLQPGQTLKPGDPVGQIDSEGQWKLAADVDQFYLGRVAVGQRAVADVGGQSVSLHVLKILPQVTDGRFKVELGFDSGSPAALNRGQTVDVRVILGPDRMALIVPAGGWLDGGGNVAFVVDASGRRAERRPITTGRRNPDQVEVLSGLRSSERIITSPITSFAKYDEVSLR